MEAFRKIYPSEFYKKFLLQSVRPDGRSLQKARRTTVSVGSFIFSCQSVPLAPGECSQEPSAIPGSITTAHGSAFVKIGNTALVCGVRAEMGTQAPEGARQLGPHCLFLTLFARFLMPLTFFVHPVVNVELLPICNAQFRPGKPSDQAHSVAQLLNDLW